MTSEQDVQMLLRFLSQDAKVPLPQAMKKIKDLQDSKLITPTEIAKAEFDSLKTLFGDDRLARQVLNAAKRVTKKRTSSDISTTTTVTPPPKRPKQLYGMVMDPVTYEASLALPDVRLDADELMTTVVHTNRAPLILAFAVTLLKYTMPEQPLSSRLSLAQAVCSANSQGKAKSIGIQRGMTAEEQGWGEGQPSVTIMSREISVMKRWGYEWKKVEAELPSTQETLADPEETQIPDDQPRISRISTKEMLSDTQATVTIEEDPPLWGVDLEALKKTNGPVTIGGRTTSSTELPVYQPERTRTYLMHAFETKTTPGERKPTGKQALAVKEHNLGMLLRSLDLLYQSWDSILSTDELDNKAWNWYIKVRPDVKAGAAGWGGKGDVALSDVLNLRQLPGYKQSSIA
ncbi:hypothetical protein P280DRAFT_391609 [Massarina eburnea CBS 473.64]|uniref:Impact N-terminal domain-containing protein n=1 Tax=Massarina eburnea CBS 473.64 TaxID=1395130 RepID=A0A6A6SAR1_9PLEO|nr:hypothetical protein P280DRAFT_391609 [Massarina eburnea CBS 473.64]